MENISTRTNATFTAANGATCSYQEVFDAARKSVEIYGKTGGRELSVQALEDLFQNIVVKVLLHHKTFDPGKAQIRTWAGKIAANAQRDAFREHNRHIARFVHPGVVNDEDDEVLFFDSLEGGYAADREVEGNEAVDRIMKAIGSLSESHQFIISLQMEGMKPKKMAELIGCTPNAAATLLCRARKALNMALGSRFLANYGIAA